MYGINCTQLHTLLGDISADQPNVTHNRVTDRQLLLIWKYLCQHMLTRVSTTLPGIAMDVTFNTGKRCKTAASCSCAEHFVAGD